MFISWKVLWFTCFIILFVTCLMIWQGSLEVNPSVLIGSFLVDFAKLPGNKLLTNLASLSRTEEHWPSTGRFCTNLAAFGPYCHHRYWILGVPVHFTLRNDDSLFSSCRVEASWKQCRKLSYILTQSSFILVFYETSLVFYCSQMMEMSRDV